MRGAEWRGDPSAASAHSQYRGGKGDLSSGSGSFRHLILSWALVIGHAPHWGTVGGGPESIPTPTPRRTRTESVGKRRTRFMTVAAWVGRYPTPTRAPAGVGFRTFHAGTGAGLKPVTTSEDDWRGTAAVRYSGGRRQDTAWAGEGAG